MSNNKETKMNEVNESDSGSTLESVVQPQQDSGVASNPDVQPAAVLVGNVILRQDGSKFVARRNRNLEPGESFVCECAHDDGDYSYVCGSDWCRCMQ